ncbi:hypothetical protein V5O48_001618 [Marasmius crinis-equi]|uniref:Glycoside hydrolase family 5 domain-containing protein n=1 Tax=Marasmius crinis-equi TaxID=585013 RepID=A0ABR3FXW0_9AGAR
MASAFSVADRVVVITGGGSGIGAWLAEGFVKEGAKVYIAGRRKESLEATTNKLNVLKPNSVNCVTDITQKDDLDRLAGFVKQHETRVDVLINSGGAAAWDLPVTPENDGTVGIDSKNPFPVVKSEDPAQWDQQYRTFTWAPYTLTLMLLPLLAEAAKLGQGRGSVIMVSSIAARFWNPYWCIPAYSGAKAGLEHVAKILGARLYPHGIRVNVVSPGSFPTDSNHPDNPYAMSHASNVERLPLGRSGTPQDITSTVIFFSSAASAYITGQWIDVDGGVMLVANGIIMHSNRASFKPRLHVDGHSSELELQFLIQPQDRVQGMLVIKTDEFPNNFQSTNGLGALLLAGLVQVTVLEAATLPRKGFATTNDGQFEVDGRPFAFVGANSYWLPLLTTEEDVRDTFQEMNKAGVKVLRTWGFNAINGSELESALQTSLTYYQVWNSSEWVLNDGPQGLQRLDYVIETAAKNDIKVILAFTNNWVGYGGMELYINWIAGAGNSHDVFYTDPRIQASYQRYVKTIVERYRDSPAIFAWELMNEARCLGDLPSGPDCVPGSETLSKWYREQSDFVRSL